MPYFLASFVKHPNMAVREAYALGIKAPDGDETITAFISEDFDDAVLSPKIAALLGADYSKNCVKIEFKQINSVTMKWHQFEPIQLAFRMANNRLGENYVHIPIQPLMEFFEVFRCEPPEQPTPEMEGEPPLILLQPHDTHVSWCKTL